MTPDADADLVVLGGGLTGLTLAARLAREQSGPRVIVLEPRTEYQDDRSWCFWRPERHELSHRVSASWKTWTFSDAAGRTIRHQVPGLAYRLHRRLYSGRGRRGAPLAGRAGGEPGRVPPRVRPALRVGLELRSVGLAAFSRRIRAAHRSGAVASRPGQRHLRGAGR
ncbi:hypothetical protein E3T28_00490 [Cryobacterium sinapicolor]|uniref:FAD-dependent oxidoreductase n=1 Tax=Cryobacterium sinapicolor TaxID=1259236 RepID=A0ABY2JH61_9MICO|nr:lycopene cyclase family protein [Cryobacterium sinapicolor]TFD05700.1 hypothetical protein E3T28_00490 [Cryobacterium sinapicolor]